MALEQVFVFVFVFFLHSFSKVSSSPPCRCFPSNMCFRARTRERELSHTPRNSIRLTNHQLAVLGEIVRGDLEVEGSGALSYPAGDVVVGAVAGAEPTAVVASLANGDTTQMCAHA